MASASNLRAVGDRIEQLVGELRSSLDPSTWRRVEETIALVTDLYGAGLVTIVQLLSGDAHGPALVARLTEDELVASLFVLHGLHPSDLEKRLRGGLDDVRPYLGSHGGDVEVLEIDEATATVRLRLLGSCDGCPSSSATLRFAVERAITEAAPELVNIVVEGLAEEPPTPPTPIALSPTRAAQPVP